MTDAQRRREDYERSQLREIFKQEKGNITHTAARFGVTPPTARNKLIRYGIITKGPKR